MPDSQQPTPGDPGDVVLDLTPDTLPERLRQQAERKNTYTTAMLMREAADHIDKLEVALGQTDHFLILTDAGWSIEHLVACRPDMTACKYHQRAVEVYATGAPTTRGRWRIADVLSWRLERSDDA